jgi:hypothetical protein
MHDLALTIATISAVATAISAVAALIVMRRTPNLPEPPIMPICTTILGASMDNHISDLPTLHQGVGFDR